MGERLPSERDLAMRFDASRGAVREALKKLEQLGIANILPGGARVRALEECSLDVIGHLLSLSEPTDPSLVDDVLQVLGALIALSTRRAVERSPDELGEAREIIARLQTMTDPARRVATRIELARFFMVHSQSLVLRLIANSLRLQFGAELHLAMDIAFHGDAYAKSLRDLDQALARLDGDHAGSAMHRLFELTRSQVARNLVANLDAKQPSAQPSENPS